MPAGASRGPSRVTRERVADREERDEQPHLGVGLPGGERRNGAEHGPPYDFNTVLENTRNTMPYTMHGAATIPTMKKRRKNGWSVFMCMYQPATSKNLTTAISDQRNDDQLV